MTIAKTWTRAGACAALGAGLLLAGPANAQDPKRLANLRHRAARIGSRLSIQSGPQGSRILLEMQDAL